MKGKILFRISLAVLRGARAIAFLGLLFILVSSILELFGYESIYIEKWRGVLKFSISKTIAFTTPTLKVPAIVHVENQEQLNQVAKMVSKEVLISPNFKTGISVINPTSLQLACVIAYNVVIVIVYFFVFHFMIKIMKNVLKNEMISLTNNLYLKTIAFIIIISPIVLYILELLYVNSFSTSNTRWTNGFGVSIRSEPKFEVIIYSAIGLFIYLLSKVQDYGLRLKQENDLTV
jgi:hypothetical protein